jgi:hypothetical protein
MVPIGFQERDMLINPERADLFQSLESSGIPGVALAKLASLGITTLAELKDLWDYGNRDLIAGFLGDSPLRMSSSRSLLASRGPVAEGGLVNFSHSGRARPLVKRARGVLLSASERAARAVSPDPLPPLVASGRRVAAAASPPPVSLISKFPAIRNQQGRGTCVAFATVGYLEYHRVQRGESAQRFSEQFVYWGCKQDDGIPSEEGTFVSTARDVIKTRGACLGRTWKYNPLPIPLNEGQGPPPAGAIAEAQGHLKSARAVAAKDPEKIRAKLDQGQPVVLSVKTYSSWDFPTVGDTGEIPMPLPGSVPDGGHAICVVGYELNPRIPGGGAFIIRNSWGKTWGKLSRFAPGYGTLFFDYVKKNALEAFA